MAEEELPLNEKLAIVKSFILQSPPGELNDVLNDIKSTLAVDPQFNPAQLIPAIKQYNIDTFHSFKLAGQSSTTVLAKEAIIPSTSSDKEETSYYDPITSVTYSYNHLTSTSDNIAPLSLYPAPADSTVSFLKDLQKEVSKYVGNHYTSGGGAVFPTLSETTKEDTKQVLKPKKPKPAPVAVDEKKEDELEKQPPATHTLEFEGIKDVTDTALVETAEEVKEKAKVVEDVLDEPEEVDEKAELVGTVGDANEEGATDKEIPVDVTPAGDEEKKEIKDEEMKEPETDPEAGIVDPIGSSPTPAGLTSTAAATTDAAATEEKKEIQDEEMKDPSTDPEAGIVDPTSSSAVAAFEEDEEVDEYEDVTTSIPAVGFKDEDTFTIVLVGSKNSPTNFWTGKVRSSYILTLSTSSLVGKITTQTHYYEQGNVQLLTTSLPNIKLTSTTPKEIVKEIEKVEGDAQRGVNDKLETLGKEVFKGLRRALPVTRQKIDWDKIGGYRLGEIGMGGAARKEEEA